MVALLVHMILFLDLYQYCLLTCLIHVACNDCSIFHRYPAPETCKMMVWVGIQIEYHAALYNITPDKA